MSSSRSRHSSLACLVRSTMQIALPPMGSLRPPPQRKDSGNTRTVATTGATAATIPSSGEQSGGLESNCIDAAFPPVGTEKMSSRNEESPIRSVASLQSNTSSHKQPHKPQHNPPPPTAPSLSRTHSRPARPPAALANPLDPLARPAVAETTESNSVGKTSSSSGSIVPNAPTHPPIPDNPSWQVSVTGACNYCGKNHIYAETVRSMPFRGMDATRQKNLQLPAPTTVSPYQSASEAAGSPIECLSLRAVMNNEPTIFREGGSHIAGHHTKTAVMASTRFVPVKSKSLPPELASTDYAFPVQGRIPKRMILEGHHVGGTGSHFCQRLHADMTKVLEEKRMSSEMGKSHPKHDMGELKSRCISCEMRRHLCDSIHPQCGNCSRMSFICNWDEDGDILQHLPSHLNLSGTIDTENLCSTSKVLGTGGFGVVYRAYLKGAAVAVKIPFRRHPVRRQTVLCLREAETWSKLTHSNIIRLLGVTVDPTTRLMCFVSPLMENGNVAQFLRKRPEQNRMVLIFGIAKGVRYLHECKPAIVHGDLKANNVLITAGGEALLSDFGVSYVAQALERSLDSDTSSSIVAAARWAAPERLRPDLYGMSYQATRSTASDIFAMFRTFLEIVSNKKPFHTTSNVLAVTELVSKGVLPEHPGESAIGYGLTNGLWALMLDGWHWDPKCRPSSATVVEFLERNSLPSNSAEHLHSCTENAG